MEEKKQPRRPSHSVFIVEGEGDKAQWTEIGAMWTHDDGQGFNLNLKAVPTTSRLVVRVRQAKTDGKRGQ